MSDESKRSLEDFALKGMHLSKMTGVSVALHAISDSFLLQHSGVGCKYKAAAQSSKHDWAEHPNRREAWTQVSELSLIRGSGARIGPFARTWFERRRPGFMAVVSAYFIELTGEDIRDIVEETRKTLPCPMVVVQTAAPNGGFYDGYASVLKEVIKDLDWKSGWSNPREVTLMGHFFTRFEPDQKGDVAQLKGLIKSVGLNPGPILFSGTPYADSASAPRSEIVAILPYARPIAKAIRRTVRKRTVVELDLPIGVAGTVRWARELSEATGGDPRLVARVEAQATAVRNQLETIIHHFPGLRVAVFADTPLAGGLVSLMRELGVAVPLVGLRETWLGGEQTFRDTVARNGLTLDGDCTILEAPSLRTVRSEVLDRLASGDVHLIIGSSHELNVLTHAVDMDLAPRTAMIEAGYPSNSQHAAYAVPTLGFTGVVAWAQRLLDAVFSPRLGQDRLL